MSTRSLPPSPGVHTADPGSARADIRIASLTARVVRRRYRVPFDISSGSSPHLTSLLIELGADSPDGIAGVVGIGETTAMTAYSGETTAGLLDVLERCISPAVVGRSVFDLAGLHVAMDQAIRGRPQAKAAVDIALLDLQGKVLGTDVATLLGGHVIDRVRIAWVVGLGDIDDAVRESVERAEAGFGHIKVKGGIDPHRDVDLVTELAHSLPPGTEIALDANEGYDLTTALPSLRQMESAGLSLLEQPLPAWDVDGMARLSATLDVPVMADESLQSVHDAADLARRRACDVFNVKILKVGGLHRARQIAGIAEAAGIPVKVGSMPEMGVATLAGAHFAASSPVAIVPADLVGPLMIDSDVLAAPVIDLAHCPGYIEVPRGVGLGATLVPDVFQDWP